MPAQHIALYDDDDDEDDDDDDTVISWIFFLKRLPVTEITFHDPSRYQQ